MRRAWVARSASANLDFAVSWWSGMVGEYVLVGL